MERLTWDVFLEIRCDENGGSIENEMVFAHYSDIHRRHEFIKTQNSYACTKAPLFTKCNTTSAMSGHNFQRVIPKNNRKSGSDDSSSSWASFCVYCCYQCMHHKGINYILIYRHTIVTGFGVCHKSSGLTLYCWGDVYSCIGTHYTLHMYHHPSRIRPPKQQRICFRVSDPPSPIPHSEKWKNINFNLHFEGWNDCQMQWRDLKCTSQSHLHTALRSFRWDATHIFCAFNGITPLNSSWECWKIIRFVSEVLFRAQCTYPSSSHGIVHSQVLATNTRQKFPTMVQWSTCAGMKLFFFFK